MNPTRKIMPVVVSARVDERRAVYAIDIDADLHAFEGHYPGNPILAGVVQVDWAMRFAREAFSNAPQPVDWNAFSGIDQLKFHQIIRPGERLELHLDWSAETGKLAFSYESEAAGRKSAGQIRLGAR
jgi:3-hydroxymyristoyl/3-hydroxydecanoyl-(acyl carrier protein) dehydratase